MSNKMTKAKKPLSGTQVSVFKLLFTYGPKQFISYFLHQMGVSPLCVCRVKPRNSVIEEAWGVDNVWESFRRMGEAKGNVQKGTRLAVIILNASDFPFLCWTISMCFSQPFLLQIKRNWVSRNHLSYLFLIHPPPTLFIVKRVYSW